MRFTASLRFAPTGRSAGRLSIQTSQPSRQRAGGSQEWKQAAASGPPVARPRRICRPDGLGGGGGGGGCIDSGAIIMLQLRRAGQVAIDILREGRASPLSARPIERDWPASPGRGEAGGRAGGLVGEPSASTLWADRAANWRAFARISLRSTGWARTAD